MPAPAVSLIRRLLGGLTVLLLALLVLPGLSGTAHAADGFRYWNYFHLQNGSWEFAKTGAAEFVPEDRSVEGYRYGTSTTAKGITPRADLDEVTFEAICAEEEAADGEKRVGVLLDYGVASDADRGETPPAPRGACAVVPEDANGQQVLQSVADVRIEKSLTCGLDGYPVKTCSSTVPNAQVPQEQPVAFDLPASEDTQAASDPAEDGSTDTGLLWPLVGIGLVIVLIAAVTLAMNRRNKSRV